MQITPFKINTLPIYNNICRNTQYPKFNNYLEKDTVCFTSIKATDFREQMYKQWDERMTDSDGFGIPFTRFHCIEGYNEALKEFDVKNFIRLGGESAVFELNDGNILKLSTEKYMPYLEDYYAPEVDRGELSLSKKYTARNDKPSQRFETDKIYYVIQEKGVPLIDSKDADELCNKAKAEGLKITDTAASQFAYFNTEDGKMVKCIDLGCIIDKSYPVSRDFEAIERMSPQDITKPYGMTYFTLKKYFSDLFKDNDDINKYIQSIKPRIDNGENIFDIMNNLLSKTNKPLIEHIKTAF